MRTKNCGTNKIKTFFKSYYKYIIFALCLLILNIFFLGWNFKTNSLTFGKVFIFMLIGSIILEITLCIILFIAKNKSWRIEKIFLILGLIIGIIYVFALPISRAPDEESHFFRIYEITTGHIISDTAEDGIVRGSVQASNIEIVRDFKENNVKYIDVINNLANQADDSNKSFIRTSASSYNPIIYSPQILGMSIGEALHLPFLVNAYIAKLFNLLICILILYFSIKHIPFLKEFIFFIAFLPITMQAMSSLSADGFITVTAIALISFVLYSIYGTKKPFTKKHYLIMLCLCLVLSLSKIIYAFLCFLLFAIPKERFKNQKTKFILIFTIGGICATILLIWLYFSSPLNNNIDPTNQRLLFSNPLKYVAIFIHSLSTNFYLYLNGTLGGHLEWFNITLSPLYIFPSAIVFALLCKRAREIYSVTKSMRIISTSVFIIIFLLSFVAMFTQWTKPNEIIIDGVQGRYFLPILLLVPIIFISTRKTNQSKKISNLQQNYYLYGFFIFESVYAITAIACTHL